MKHTIELEVDIPDGWELTGEFVIPIRGKHIAWIAPDGTLQKWGNGVGTHIMSPYGPRLILRRKWVWPEWLKANWIAMSNKGNWYAYDMKKPRCSDSGWYGTDKIWLSVRHLGFTPPPCDDWRESLMRNPNLENDDD